ncbi:MAG: metal-sulfur cluster assembly factor [candidate division Zixibacteria bacterium]|nr:metal-sulfur cluster assembly factor [candidate division Zixibacteria bacterium]
MSEEKVSPPTKEKVFEALVPVQDPEIHISIVDLGLIYDALITDEGEVTIKMTLTTPACPYGEMLIAQTQKAVADMDGVTDAKVDIVWEPLWDPKEMASDYAKDLLGIW